MQEKPLIEYAFEVLSKSKKSMSFKKIFDSAIKLTKKQYTEAEIKQLMSKLYTALTIDERFTSLEGNEWDLRSRRTFAESYVNIDELVAEDDDAEVDEEEKKLLAQELGEETDDSSENESDDLDFDKPKQGQESDEDF